MNLYKYVLIGVVVIVILFLLIISFHIRHFSDEINFIYENHNARLDTLLLSFAYRPVIIDSFIFENDTVENNNTKILLDSLSKFNQSQINELINEVNKNSLQFNKILTSADSRLSLEMSSLNKWVTIWVGFFAFLTIFIPICTYLISTKELNKKVILMKNEIDTNNAQLEIYTILSILKELSFQTETFFDNEGRNNIIMDLLLDGTSKMRHIFQNKNVLFDKKSNQFINSFKIDSIV